ncbi:MAG: hypothetical protein JNJ41_12455 [Bacteroidia bacterium]|nr:hypothetical protein [Bacteroidia bacterium]
MSIFKEIKGNELYLYIDGVLIYKRWLDTGQSKIFDVMAYDKYTLTSIRDQKFEKMSELFVKARLKLNNNRKTGFRSSFRPNHVFEYYPDGIIRTFIGEIRFEGDKLFMPGEEAIVTVCFMLSMPLEKYINVGRQWFIHEGGNKIGDAEILEILDETSWT